MLPATAPQRQRIGHHAVDHGERVRPRVEDVARAQPERVPAETFGVEVAISVDCELVRAVPSPSVDFDADAVFDDEILVPQPGHVPLGFHPVARLL